MNKTDKEEIFQFDEKDIIGHVISVDTIRTYIAVDDSTLTTKVPVGKLIAIEGSTPLEFFIGMVERVTRSTVERQLTDEPNEEGEISIGDIPNDIIRTVLIGTFLSLEGDDCNIFRRGVSSYPNVDRKCYIVEAFNLQRLMNLLGSNVEEEKRLKLGQYFVDPKAIAIVNGDRFFQRHAAILGSTGSGKSWTVSLILEKAAKLQYPNLIVFDLHGEYTPLTDSNTEIKGFARQLRIAGPGDLIDPRPDTIFLPYWLLNREEMLAILLDRNDQNAPNQAARFTEHVRTLKEKKLKEEKREDISATFTVDSPIPYKISELVEYLVKDNIEMVQGVRGEKQGEWHGKLTRFIARLQAKIEDRRYGFLFKPLPDSYSYNWLRDQAIKLLATDEANTGIKVVDFSEVPSDVLPIVISVFARLLYDIQFWKESSKRTPFCFVCDEAHLYLPIKDQVSIVEQRAVETFERIAKEGRKYGVSLLVISQRPSDVSQTILSQCNNFLVLRLTNDRDQNTVKRLMPDSMSGLVDMLPLLDIGESLLLGDSVLLPTRIKLDKPSIEPFSATHQFWTEWHRDKPDINCIEEAIESMRRQTRKIKQ